MPTILNFKDIVDLPKWRMLATPTTLSNGFILSDFRNNEDRHPAIFNINRPSGSNNIDAYYVKNDEWIFINGIGQATSPAAATIMPCQGPRGTITTTGSNSSFTLSTALPATVGVNQLANRGDGRGFKVRIIGNSAGGSGKTEERLIVANTSGTTPTINVNTAFSFIPATGDAYEFLSGRLFIFDTTWNYYDILTNSFSANLSTTGGPSVGATNDIFELDELYVPYDRSPGDGFKGLLTATASGAASITGQAVGGDANVVTNEHRNFQIRIVNDIGTPTASGQRRNITSHTAGPSPVYTVAAWAVQPSATAQYVIENNSDKILFWTSSNANTYTYSISGNTWDTNVTFGARPSALSTGAPYARQSFSIEPDIALNSRHSFVFSPRGNGNVIDLLDIAGGAAGLWTSSITYANGTNVQFGGVSTGSCFSTQDPATMQGRYMYMFPSNYTNRLYRFDMQNRVLEAYANNKLPATAFNAYRPGYTVYVDGNIKLSFIVCLCQTSVLGLLTMGVPVSR